MTDLYKAAEMALEALKSNKRNHYYCEDTWYSCPKHEDGCANDSNSDECNCGADEINQQIDIAITALRQALAQPEHSFDTPESHIVKWSIPVDPNNFGEPLAQPEQEEPLPLVDIGVDVTSEGTHVVACYNRPDAVQEMFYSKFHPMPKRVPVEWDDDEWVKKAMEMSRDFVDRAKARQQPPPTDTITMAELRKTDLYRKVRTQLLRDILRGDNT